VTHLPATRGCGFGLQLTGPDLDARWLPRKAGTPFAAPILPGCCLMMRRTAFDATGGWDGGLLQRGGVDNEMSVRLWLLGYDLLTGVFVLSPLALVDKRHGVTAGGVLRNWGLVFVGNFLGALTVAVMMAIVFTFCFSTEPSPVGKVIASIGESRTLGYKSHGAAGMLTLFIRGVLCNWMVSTGVVGAMVSTTVGGKVLAMWMPIMLFFGMAFEHSVVNMFLFPSALLMGGKFSVTDYLVWNELPTVLGNMVGGITFTGLTLYSTYVKTAPRRFSLVAPGEPTLDSGDAADLEAQATNQSGWTVLPSDRPASRAR